MKNDIKWDEPHSFGFWLEFGFRSIFENIAYMFECFFSGGQIKARYIDTEREDKDE